MDYQKRITGARNKASGEMFERACDSLFGELRARRFAHIQKTPEPLRVCGRTQKPGLFAAVFTKQAQPDYQGTMQSGQSVVIEAKYTDSERIQPERITDMQAAELDRHEAMGAVAAVIVCFGYKSFGIVPWEEWKRLPEIVGRKSLKESDLATHGWKLDNSSFRRLADGVELTLWSISHKQKERFGNGTSNEH